eukprot:EG_transcript_1946
MAEQVTVAVGFNIWYQIGAALTCFSGCHSSLMLACASIRLQLPMLMVLAGVQFMVQTIFSVHYISMCGLDFGVPWGFDIALTLTSLAVGVLFGGAAVALALYLRHHLEPAIVQRFGGPPRPRSLLFYGRLLAFILSRVSLRKLLLAVVLMVCGSGGCHHIGLWSIHGMKGGQLMSELTVWTSLITVVLGGFSCAFTVVAFLLVPEGVATPCLAFLLAGVIAAFHYCSIAWGLRYVLGAEGISSHAVMGEEAIVLFIVAQSTISQLITARFSEMSIEGYDTGAKQLAVAESLGKYIATMDLDSAKQVQMEAVNPSALEQTLFQIVDNLVLYRPYLPDTLFSGPGSPSNEEAAVADGASDKSDGSDGERTSNGSLFTQSQLQLQTAFPRSSTDSPKHRRPTAPRDRKAAKHLSLGLRSSHLTVLRIRLQGLQFGDGRSLNQPKVEEVLAQFMALATSQIKANGGTIVVCAGGAAVAIWPTLSPDAALEAAVAIQRHSSHDLIQVVQSGFFLSGNLATEHLRSFNLVGPMDWTGQLLLRVGAGGRHIFITNREWERVRYKYLCLPYEYLLAEDTPVTVYSVQPFGKDGPEARTEWMYELVKNLQSGPLEAVDRAWQAYLRGQYAEVLQVADGMADVPPWYPVHITALAESSAKAQVKLPVKSLEALGWPTPSAIPPHHDLVREL